MRIFTFLLVMLVTACSPQQGVADRGDRSEIIRLSDADTRGLDPQMVSDLASIRVATDQFEGLTRFNASGQPEPGLAEGWRVSADGIRWDFKLRPGITFSDGEPINAYVFVQALVRIRDRDTASPHIALFAAIDRIEDTKSETVRIILKQPFPQLPALLAHPAMAALPFHIIDVAGEKWTAQRPLVTSGPYRLTDWQLAQAVTLKANPRWHGGAPATPTIIWRPMENAQTAMRVMLANGADISGNFPASRIGWLKENYADMLRLSDYLGTYYFAFNTRRPPFDDGRVRRALSLAIDREWIANEMIAAGNAPAYGLLPPGLAKNNGAQLASKPKNLVKARAILAEAGYGPKRPLSFEIRFNSSAEHRRAATAMATMWREIGVDAKLLNSEASLHFDALRRGDFDLARSGWIADFPAPENFLAVHRADAGAQNYSGYANPDYDKALDAALAQQNPEKRLAMMRAAEQILVADMPVLPLYFYSSRNLVQDDIGGWQANNSNMHPSRYLFRKGK